MEAYKSTTSHIKDRTKNIFDAITLDYCCELNEITGQMNAYRQVLNWSYEPGVNESDLRELIQKEITNLINESNEIQSKKNEN